MKEEEVIQALDEMKGSQYFVTGFEVPMKIALSGAKHAKELGMITALKSKSAPEEDMGRLDYVDYLFINEVEAKYICQDDDEKDPKELMNKVR